MARTVDEDELIEHWTLVGEELGLVAGKRGPTKLAFGLMLKFYTLYGRFPRGRGELPDEAVAYLARQVSVPAADVGLYEWDGRTSKYHRTQIRTFTGFRECSVADAEKVTVWLAEHVCQQERKPDRVRAALLAHLKSEGIEPPAKTRLGRIIGSALRQAEETLTLRIFSKIPTDIVERMLALIARAADDPDEQAPGNADTSEDSAEPADADAAGNGDGGPDVFAAIKEDPGNVSLKSIEREVFKLGAIGAVDLGEDLFAEIAPKVLAGVPPRQGNTSTWWA